MLFRRGFSGRLRRAALAAAAAALLAPSAARAGLEERAQTGKTLYRLTGEADAIVTGTIVSVAALYSVPGEFSKRAPRLKVTGVLKGAIKAGELLTFIYKADLARGYRDGDGVLVFLQRTGGDPLFRGVQTARWVSWYNPESERSKIEVTPQNRQSLVAAVSRYAALISSPSVEDRETGLRRAFLEDLASPSRLVARDALDELIAQPQARAALTSSELGTLARLAGGKAEDPYVRAGAVRLLAEHPGGAPYVAGLLRSAPDERLRLEALGAVEDRRLRSAAPQVLALLASPSAPTRDAAARVLASVGDESAIEALAATARKDPVPAVQASAVRAIGAIGGVAGRARLEELAAGHPDSRVRDLARRRLGGRI